MAKPRRHSDGADGASIPLKEEGPRGVSPPQDTQGVGVDGAQPVGVSEVAGCPAVRVELDDLPEAGACQPRKDRDEGVDGGGTPMHIATAIGIEPTVVEALLDRGADINAKTDTGTTPCEQALRRERFTGDLLLKRLCRP